MKKKGQKPTKLNKKIFFFNNLLFKVRKKKCFNVLVWFSFLSFAKQLRNERSGAIVRFIHFASVNVDFLSWKLQQAIEREKEKKKLCH